MNIARDNDGTVGKALSALELVAAFERPVRFSEVLEHSPYPKATLYRFLQTLTNQGLLQYEPNQGVYSMGMRLVRLAHSAWRQSSLGPLSRHILDDLYAEVGQTLHLAQMDAGQVLYIEKRTAIRPVEMFSQAGKVGPAYCTGVGKAMLAYLDTDALDAALQKQAFYQHTQFTHGDAHSLTVELDQIRTEGYSFDREEHEAGIICIAKPILLNERPVGALSITTTTTRHSFEDLIEWKKPLSRAVDQIAQAAKDWQFPTL